MELFAIICLALIIVAVIVFTTWIWINTRMLDGGHVWLAIFLTFIFTCLVAWLGYWLIVWGGQYFINMGWWYFDQTTV